jgi:uncharacterized membrane protein
MPDGAHPPPEPGSLTVWIFESPRGADEALPRLERMARERLIVLDDAAIVAWPQGCRKPSTRPLGSLSGPGTLWGGFWGVLLGLIFLVPLAGPVFGAAAGAFAGTLADFGIDDGFIMRVRDTVTPGTSALFVLSSGAAADGLGSVMQESHVALIRSDLSSDDQELLAQVLGEESLGAEDGTDEPHEGRAPESDAAA